MEAPILVSVIVVTWNGMRFLERCLTSLMASLDRVPGACEVIVVDNGSSDSSVSYMRQSFPAVILLQNATNTGFAEANNRALRLARGEFVALLNNDTEVERSWMSELVEAMRTDSGLGSCAPQVRFLHHPDRINSAGIVVDRSGAACDRLGGEPISAGEHAPVEVFGPSGAAALFRQQMLDEIGLYDPLFFAYLEDVDHAWRARRAGWRCLYVPSSIVYHVHSGTSRQGSSYKAYLLSRNQIWLLARNASHRQLVRYAPRIALRLCGVIAYNVVVGRTLAPVKGAVAAILRLPRAGGPRHRLPFLPLDAFAPVGSPIRELSLRVRRDRLAK